jgi:hypothetical protein
MHMRHDRLPVSLSASTETHVFDRARLMIDLDEAVDPDGPVGTLLVVGFRRRRERLGSQLTRNDVVILDRLGELLGSLGPVYRTRTTEICALLELTGDELDPLLEEIHVALVELQRSASIAVGTVTLTEEALDADSALALADLRLLGQVANPPIVSRLSSARVGDEDPGAETAVVIDLFPSMRRRSARRVARPIVSLKPI